MPLTRSFRETVQARARRDVKFRQALLGEAMQALLDGNLEEGRSALRSCINATIGFEKLGAALGRSPKSLMPDVRSAGQSHRRKPARRHRRIAGKDRRSPASARRGSRSLIS
jgi:hypothetical protein